MLCQQARTCSPCWLGLELIPKAGVEIALFRSVIRIFLKTRLGHFVESQNGLGWRDLKGPSILTPLPWQGHFSGPGVGTAAVIP